jgi:excisionase family DNA binding protein
MSNPFETIDARLSNIENLLLDLKHPPLKPLLDKSTEDPLIKIEEVCKILGVSKVTIHSYKKKGFIPFLRLSNKVYFRRSEVLASLSKINGGV